LPPDRPLLRLVIDEQMPWSLALELRKRGFRDATSAKEMGMEGRKDPVWLKFLSEQSDACVLVTFDNKMVQVHTAELRRYRNALAIVDSKGDRGGLYEHEYYRDVIHRWAHRMAAQREGMLRKYTRSTNALVTL
jgi:hypothetical protein